MGLFSSDVFDLNELINQISQNVKQMIPPGGKLIIDSPTSPIWILGERHEIGSAIECMLINAMNRSSILSESRCWFATRQDRVLIVFEDTGPALMPDDLNHLLCDYYEYPTVGDRSIELGDTAKIIDTANGVAWAEHIIEDNFVAGLRCVVGLPTVKRYLTLNPVCEPSSFNHNVN